MMLTLHVYGAHYLTMGPPNSVEPLLTVVCAGGYVTTRCAIMHFMAANPGLNIEFHFMEDVI